MAKDRRRYPRVGVTLDLTVEAGGQRWQGRTLNLSPYGVKVALPGQAPTLEPGATVQLRLAPLQGDRALSLTAQVVRRDRDGIALNFVNVEADWYQALKGFVDSLLRHLSTATDGTNGHARRARERRKGPRVEVALDVSFEAPKPYDWRGKTVDLSPYGVKVALPAASIRPGEGTSVRLRLAQPDGEPLAVKGMVWRREPKSTVLLFVDLSHQDLDRLSTLVDSLRAQPA